MMDDNISYSFPITSVGTLYNPDNYIYNNFIRICKVGNASNQCIKQLLEFSTVLKKYNMHQICYTEGFKIACYNNNIQMANYLYTTRNVITGAIRTLFDALFGPTRYEISDDILLICCEKENISIVSWILRIQKFSIDSLILAFNIVLVREFTEIMEYIFLKLSEETNITLYIYELFGYILTTGRKKILHWLDEFCEKYNYRECFSKYVPEIFCQACSNSYENLSEEKKNKYHIANCNYPCTIEDNLYIFLYFANREKYLDNNIIYQGFTLACNSGNLNIAMIINDKFNKDDCTSNIHSIDIFKDPHRIPFFEAIFKKQYHVVEWLGELQNLSMTFTFLGSGHEKVYTLNVSTNIGSKTPREILCDSKKCIQKILINKTKYIQKSKIYVDNDDLNKISNTGVKIDWLLLERLILYAVNNKQSCDLLYKCDGCNDAQIVSIVIQIEKYISNDILYKILYDSDTIKERNVVAKLIANNDNMYSDNNLQMSYKDLMVRKLGLTTILNEPYIYKYESDCCPLCLGEYDMMLDCGHVICMMCAHSWYFIKKEPLICQVCRNIISFEKSVCLC
jgi:hypothetical protein